MTVTLENGFLKQQLAAQSSATASAVKLVIVNLMPNKLNRTASLGTSLGCACNQKPNRS